MLEMAMAAALADLIQVGYHLSEPWEA